MSSHLFFEPSASLFNNMDVDGGDGNDSTGAGVDDWTQNGSLFHSPPQPTTMPPPAAPSRLSLGLSALVNASSGSSANNTTANNNNNNNITANTANTTSPPAGTPAAGASSSQLLRQTPSPKSKGRIVSPNPVSSVRKYSAQRDSMSHSIFGVPSAAGAAATTTTPSARSKEREQLLSGPLMFRNPLPITTIVIHGQKFFIHTELLCKQSDYFTGCLRGGFTEAETQRVEINDEDVSVEDFGLWVDLLYRSHFQKPDTFLLRKEDVGGTLSTMQILTLWKLSDRFLNRPLAALTEESLQHRLSLYSVEQWRKLYRTRPASDIKSRVCRLQGAYRYCCDQELPFVTDLVAACANCPAQVYAECASLLEVDFMMLVSQRMIMAHADNQLVSKDQRASAAGSQLGGSKVQRANATGQSNVSASDSGGLL